MIPRRRHEAGPWLGLALILSLFLLYWVRLHPTEVFGLYHDDTVYFASAQALAQGQGYIMPSVPGAPRQTKYPPLYPWILSWVWRWNPSFPDNLRAATSLTAIFACWFLAAAFAWLRRLEGLGNWPALFLTALCAFHPVFLALSRTLMSEVPFMALVMTAALLADCGLHPGGGAKVAVIAGLVAGAAVLVRAVGLAVAIGFLVAAGRRRAWRQMTVFGLIVGVFATPVLSSALADPPPLPPLADTPGLGFHQTWLFYTSYWGFWKASVPDTSAFLSLLGLHLRAWLMTPGWFCLFPPFNDGKSTAGVAITMASSIAILTGILRQARAQGWQPLHYAFLTFSGLLLVWNYLLMDRCLVLFLPLFYVGLWFEVKQLMGLIRTDWRRGGWSRRISATVLGLLLASVLFLATRRYITGERPSLDAQRGQRLAVAPDKEELYQWVRRNTSPDTLFVAYEDALLYLRTGRRAMRPLVPPPAEAWSGPEAPTKTHLEHLTDVAEAIGARYWIVASDDHLRLGPPPRLPLVFRSSGGKVQVFDRLTESAPVQTTAPSEPSKQ